jgi:hypothetical protein
MTLLRLAIALMKVGEESGTQEIKNCSGEQFFIFPAKSGDAQEVLEVHVAVEAEAVLDAGDDVGSAL